MHEHIVLCVFVCGRIAILFYRTVVWCASLQQCKTYTDWNKTSVAESSQIYFLFPLKINNFVLRMYALPLGICEDIAVIFPLHYIYSEFQLIEVFLQFTMVRCGIGMVMVAIVILG